MNAPDEPVTVPLTREAIHAQASSFPDGFTRAQIEALGYAWPPPRGWLSALVGTRIPVVVWDRFVAARTVYANRKE
jgi:hypothetical protein